MKNKLDYLKKKLFFILLLQENAFAAHVEISEELKDIQKLKEKISARRF
jgi:hypothetical protein